MTSRWIDKEALISSVDEQSGEQKLLNRLGHRVNLNIDSRTIAPGDVFLALRGELADGHDYIAQALDKGASLVVAESDRRHKIPAHWPVVFVSDTLKFFSKLAHHHLKKMPAVKVAITGSNGKTTTKEMLKALLIEVLGQDRVYASPGTKNNHFGLPLSAMQVTPQHKIAIFEMGMNHPGEIASLCAIVEPDVGAITNIGMVHKGNFVDGIDGVMRAKGELFLSLAQKTQGNAVINIDDERVVKQASLAQLANKTTFGHRGAADIKVVSYSPYCSSLGLQEVLISIGGGPAAPVPIPLAGSHNANNVACALAVVKALGLPVERAIPGLMGMTKTPGRMSLNKTKGGSLIINDGYNANPVSMKAGIMASHEFPAKRRIAVIGAMGELGHDSPQHHFELGELLAHHFDHLFICGEAALKTVLGAKSKGMDDSRIVFAGSSLELIPSLKELLKEGDLVFIKGSKSANMQAVAEALLPQAS